MGSSAWLCVLVMCCVYTSGSSTPSVTVASGGDVGSPVRVANETAWISRVSLTQAPDSVVLVLLASVGHSGYEPCTEFSPVCCLGLQLRDNVWGGDVDVLDQVRHKCRVQGGGPWETVLAPLKSRNYSDVQFTLADMYNPWRGVHTMGGIYTVSVIVLVVKRWSGCVVIGEDACILQLQVLQQKFEVDTQRTEQSTSVSLPPRCTQKKPEHAIWFPSTTQCDWFCTPDFIRCSGNTTNSTASCRPLPEVGAALHLTVAVTWVSTGYLRNQEPFDLAGAFEGLSAAVATRMTAAGVVGVHRCSVVLRETVSVVSSGDIPVVEMPVVDGLVRTERGLYYNGVGLQETPTQYVNPSANTPVELPDVDDRILPGYSEFTVIMYSSDTTVPLTNQALLLRYVLIDSLAEDSNVESVVYASGVRGVLRVSPPNVNISNSSLVADILELSTGEFIGLLLWAMLLITVFMMALFYPQLYAHETPTEKTVAGGEPSCCAQCTEPSCCAQHSPRDRTLIAILMVLIISTILGSAVIYVFVVIPTLQSAPADERPLLTLGWLWCMCVVSILLVVGYCFVAAGVRRFGR
jgi:hypothetical protein